MCTDGSPVDDSDDFSARPVAVGKHLVVHAKVLKHLDDSERRARQDRLDGAFGRGVVPGRSTALERRGQMRRRRRPKRDGRDEPDASGVSRRAKTGWWWTHLWYRLNRNWWFRPSTSFCADTTDWRYWSCASQHFTDMPER